MSFDTLARHNNFLNKKQKLDEKNKRWKSKIIDKHIGIISKVNEINSKKDKAVRIAHQLSLLNTNISDASPNRDLIYSFNRYVMS